MKIDDRVKLLATATGERLKVLKGEIGNLPDLTTTAKDSLVEAINELQTSIGNSLAIDDTATTADKVWSAQKISATITAEIAKIINGAGEDEDSLKELADKITALAQADGGLVSAKEAQAFTDDEKTQARNNIGAVSTAELAVVGAAGVANEVVIAQNNNDIAVINAVDTDYVAVLETAYNA